MDKDVLAAWLEEGRSFEWIGRQTGKHPSTVAYWARKYGLRSTNQRKHAARGPLDAATLRLLVERDLTVNEIAREVERSPTTVRHWLSYHGLATTRAARRGRRIVEDAEELVALCHEHGPVRHVRQASGRLRCAQCNSEAVTRRRRRVKELLVAEAGGACVICGYDRWPGALHFHHVDPTTKRFHLGLKGLTRAIDNVREEAKKCVLLCANCHAEVEGGVAAVPPAA